MVLSGEWKNKIRFMRTMGNDEGAKRELRKARMLWYDYLVEDSDRFFISYCLAHYHSKDENLEICNQYLKDIRDIFLNIKNITPMKKEYCNFLWLNVNVNHEKLSKKVIVEQMNYVYIYYMELGEKDIAVSSLINIFKFEKREDKILESLEELLSCENISDWNFVKSILNDCENLSHNLYIKALSIVNSHNINIYAL